MGMEVHVQPQEGVVDFHMYLNGHQVDTDEMQEGGTSCVDISDLTENGRNTLQVSGIEPQDLEEAVKVYISYPEVQDGTLDESGISQQAVDLISDIIQSDIDFGFTSAQLAVIRNGKLVYENVWGKTNSYLPDGSVNEESTMVTADTLYDLASVTKMFSVNYALQKLVTDGEVSLDAKITEFLGDAFAEDVIDLSSADDGSDEGNGDDEQEQSPSLEEIKQWKKNLTIRDLLRHQGGFPAGVHYFWPVLYDAEKGDDGYPENPLYAGHGADEATRNAMEEALCKTPLEYEPGTKTVYSDLDYVILGIVVEKITGEDLNTWLKKTFWEPMGLTHITYKPLENGFGKEDCAATELNGNLRDGYWDIPEYRDYTLQGEVHDEMAWYSMAGISGHAGLFSNASDLAKLASVMLCGGYGENRFFSQDVMDTFTGAKKEVAGKWGLGWWRQGDNQRVWYFGTQASSDTIGHQGWTGTLVMIDPDRNLVIAYLTNKINTPITDIQENPNGFDGNWYTASTLGFVPQILSIGMDSDEDISGQLKDLLADMVNESKKLIPEGVPEDGDHPAARNYQSKKCLLP